MQRTLPSYRKLPWNLMLHHYLQVASLYLACQHNVPMLDMEHKLMQILLSCCSFQNSDSHVQNEFHSAMRLINNKIYDIIAFCCVHCPVVIIVVWW